MQHLYPVPSYVMAKVFLFFFHNGSKVSQRALKWPPHSNRCWDSAYVPVCVCVCAQALLFSLFSSFTATDIEPTPRQGRPYMVLRPRVVFDH